MPTTKKRKSKLNRSADACAIALSNLLRAATEEAVQPLKTSIVSLQEGQDALLEEIVVLHDGQTSLQKGQDALLELVKETKNEVSTLRENMQAQLKAIKN